MDSATQQQQQQHQEERSLENEPTPANHSAAPLPPPPPPPVGYEAPPPLPPPGSTEYGASTNTNNTAMALGLGGGGNNFTASGNNRNNDTPSFAPQQQQLVEPYTTVLVPVLSNTVMTANNDSSPLFPPTLRRPFKKWDTVEIPYNRFLVALGCAIGLFGWVVYLICRAADEVLIYVSILIWVFALGLMGLALVIFMLTRKSRVQFHHDTRMCTFYQTAVVPYLLGSTTHQSHRFDDLDSRDVIARNVYYGSIIEFKNTATQQVFLVEKVKGDLLERKHQWERYLQEIQRPGSVSGGSSAGWECSGEEIRDPVNKPQFPAGVPRPPLPPPSSHPAFGGGSPTPVLGEPLLQQ